MNRKYNCFALLFCLCLCLAVVCSAQTKIDWKQIKNIPDTLDFKNVLLEHLLFKAAYQPVLDPAYQGAIYYDNRLNRLRVYENGEWRDMSVTIASDSIGAPLTILGYLQASDIYASRSAYINNGVYATGTSVFQYLKVNNALKIPTVASKTLGVGSIYYDSANKKVKVLNSSNNWDIVSVDVDSALSATSTNPVQNKVIYTKFDNFDASVTQELQQTLLDAYNYANGIATQAYNYADGVATDAYSAARQYADTQILVIDGRINTLNTNLLASLTEGISTATTTALMYASSAVSISEEYAAGLATQTLNAAASYTLALRQYVDTQDAQTHTNALASASKLFVSLISTGSTNGTITMVKDNTFTDVPVKGLGSAAFANVASFTPQSSSTPPSNPYNGQLYFDTGSNKLKYWNGTAWTDVGGGADISYGTDSTKQTCFSVGDMQIITGVATTSADIYTPTVVNFVHDFTATPTIAISQNATLWCPIMNITTHSFTVTFGAYENIHNFNSSVNWIAIGKR